MERIKDAERRFKEQAEQMSDDELINAMSEFEDTSILFDCYDTRIEQAYQYSIFNEIANRGL